ncbi:MAG: DUF1499 domain-containing protein [Gammaproteobacteria bacterium HGW-Gammaproteobacteria-14]|nr:MAG: DUF1499 domain-containing protein [Gammaproteobacteria bacterium HGW-Gammaproteobacteria-14]
MLCGGAAAGSLPDCPNTPNCVSSQASDPARMVDPLSGGDDQETALQRLQTLLNDLPRVEWQAVATSHGPVNKVEAQFRSRIFRFVDDVTFLIEENGTIQVRSASRIGYSDLGANRSRVDMLRQRLQDAPNQALK